MKNSLLKFKRTISNKKLDLSAQELEASKVEVERAALHVAEQVSTDENREFMHVEKSTCLSLSD